MSKEGSAVTIQFEPAGELRTRLDRNYDRLESERWQPEAENVEGLGVFKNVDYAWPGDNEGRTLLAWTSLERATGRTAKFAERLVERLDEFTNEHGYFGALVAPLAIDEQQLSGHGWLLRALSERWELTGDPRLLDRLGRIADALAEATRGAHAEYPIDPAARVHGLGVIGEESQVLGRWKLSSDIGCDFIFLDGLAHAASVLDRPHLDEVVEEIIARFLEVRVIEIRAQTHATLTGARALVRWHDRTGRPELLEHAERLYDLYRTAGMSEAHENWNWFERPTHTEACAVVDSFMVAVQLWQRTGRSDRLADAHRIYYNGLGHSQRDHGGFGCDTVLGAGEHPRSIAIEIDEAWWCCTMRGADGLGSARDFAVQGDSESLTFPFLFSGAVRQTDVDRALTVTSAYPNEGRLSLRLDTGAGAVRLSFYRPPWASEPTVTLNGRPITTVDNGDFTDVHVTLEPTDVVEYGFTMDAAWESVGNVHSEQTLAKLYRGPLLFGSGGASVDRAPAPVWDPERSVVWVGDVEFTPLSDMIERSEYDGYQRQTLF